jgi:hypothetical protein
MTTTLVRKQSLIERLLRCKHTAGEFRCCKYIWHRWFGTDMNRWSHCYYEGWHTDCKGSRRWDNEYAVLKAGPTTHRIV